jgi:ribosomal protein S18 acetylase RimI-like enzyme
VAFRIRPVRSAGDLKATAALFEAYGASLGVDLSFQDFATETATLPGKYAPPRGELLIARDPRDQPLGCVAVRPLAIDGCCEMKRLYVAPYGRGFGLGRALVDAIIREAERIGYREMRLDSLPTMTEAMSLYAKTGFVSIEPYYFNPVAGTVFLSKRLGS